MSPRSIECHILVVDNDPRSLRDVCRTLESAGYVTTDCLTSCEAFAAMEKQDFSVALIEVCLPGIDGFELCARLVDNHPTIPVVLMTEQQDAELATRGIRAGALDFVSKPVVVDDLLRAMRRAVRWSGSHPTTRRLVESSQPRSDASHRIVGSSRVMKELLDRVTRVGATESTVLITGESGTGKELVARSLHASSPRSEGPFIAVNCGAVPATLLESELFGYEKGAFTGAGERRRGLIAAADGGTLFLDEVASMPLDIQPKLLRALQERKLRPVGAAAETAFDCRVIAATRADPKEAVARGEFRQDLLFRLDVVSLHVPPLRERGRDVIELARHFLEQRCNGGGALLSKELEEALASYDWPGNVRQLDNCIQAAVAYAAGGPLQVAHLPAQLQKRVGRGWTTPQSTLRLDAIERRHIESVLSLADGNKAKAADMLGIDRTTLYRKIKRYGLESG